MDATFMVYSSKVHDGTQQKNKFQIHNQNNSIQVQYNFILGLPMMLLLPEADRKAP
jgi:hypothetical protein